MLHRYARRKPCESRRVADLHTAFIANKVEDCHYCTKPWTGHGSSTDAPRTLHGRPWAVHRSSADSPRTLKKHGSSTVRPSANYDGFVIIWVVRGRAVNKPRAIHGFERFADCPGLAHRMWTDVDGPSTVRWIVDGLPWGRSWLLDSIAG